MVERIVRFGDSPNVSYSMALEVPEFWGVQHRPLIIQCFGSMIENCCFFVGKSQIWELPWSCGQPEALSHMAARLRSIVNRVVNSLEGK